MSNRRMAELLKVSEKSLYYDFYTFVAAEMFELRLDEVPDNLRYFAKQWAFGFLYGGQR